MPHHTGLGSVSVRTREDREDAAPKDVLCSPRGFQQRSRGGA